MGEPWDPLADPADSAGCQIDPLPSGQSGLPLRPSDAGDLEAASLAALVGPLGREAALSSARMREVEEWIWKAEAEGLAPEEIIPARQRLKMLAQENRSIHWKREEEKDEKRKAQALELLKAEELLRKVVAEVATSKKEICENGEAGPTDEQVAAKLKDTIVQAYNAGADAKLLISARHKLKLLEPEPVTSEPKQRSFAKEMIQAMKEKNVDALQCIIDDALKQGVQLQGLEAARRKLAEWGAKPLDAAKRTPTTSSTVQLRIVLPDGRRGWLPVDRLWTGSVVLSSLPIQEDRSSLHFCLAQETTLRGAVEFLEQSLSLERTLAEQPEFLEKGAALACRRLSEAALWEDVMKGLAEPFPSFVQVQKLLGHPAVVLAWDVVNQRCTEAIELVGARCLVVAAPQAAPIGLKDLKVSVPMSCVDVDTDGLVDRHQVASIVQHIKALEVASPPILLVLLCRAYLSRRLVLSFRDLPEDIILLPCPPDAKSAVAEEVPTYAAQCFEEARRLRDEGVHLPQSCLRALERLNCAQTVSALISRLGL